MYGRGIYPCHHNFCGSSPFSFNFAAERIAGITIKTEIPIETVRVHDDLGDEGLDHRFGHILPFVGIGVLLQCILEDTDYTTGAGGQGYNVLTAGGTESVIGSLLGVSSGMSNTLGG